MVARALLRRVSLFKRVGLQSFISRFSSQDAPRFLGVQTSFTNQLEFVNKESYDPILTYRILSADGQADANVDFKLDDEVLVEIYRKMVMINIMDKILYESQRQGRISFYMTNTGEEAVQIGSAAALTLDDMVYAQYREAGVLLWRGYPLSKFMNQCYGNCEDEGKGRQMPVHYGSKELNYVTISSPLTTQVPQAVGAAYGFKQQKKEACVICYFGEGAASEGDAHAAFNFSTTLACPIIFLCRNNGYAISTPGHEQYKGDGIAARGPSYGMNTLRVDGNDVLAMYHATSTARQYCISEKKPVLIEAMTYRIGPHSTSDDSSAYRSNNEVVEWNTHSPIAKFRKYVESFGLWDQQKEEELISSTRKKILAEFLDAEKKLKPHWQEMFTDVYHSMPGNIRKQMLSMENHIKEYHEHYPLSSFKQTK